MSPTYLGPARVVLLHDTADPTVLTRRRDGTWANTLVPRSTLDSFLPADGHNPISPAHFEQAPTGVLGARAVVRPARGQGTTMSEPVRRVVAYGPRWQTLQDSDPGRAALRVCREATADGVHPQDLVVDTSGLIRGQVVWAGDALTLSGFIASLEDARLSLDLDGFLAAPDAARGMLAVTRTKDGATLVREGRVREVTPQD